MLNKATATLPAELTLRLSLVITPRSRMIGVTGEANFDTDSERALVEVAFSPLAWLLEVGDPSDRTSAVVSNWTEIPAGAEEDFSLRTTLGTITTAIPADYRWPSEIPDGEAEEEPTIGG